jgi:hypothetical protein
MTTNVECDDCVNIDRMNQHVIIHHLGIFHVEVPHSMLLYRSQVILIDRLYFISQRVIKNSNLLAFLFQENFLQENYENEVGVGNLFTILLKLIETRSFKHYDRNSVFLITF